SSPSLHSDYPRSPPSYLVFFFSRSAHLHLLHSFPTRRSSDLFVKLCLINFPAIPFPLYSGQVATELIPPIVSNLPCINTSSGMICNLPANLPFISIP